MKEQIWEFWVVDGKLWLGLQCLESEFCQKRGLSSEPQSSWAEGRITGKGGRRDEAHISTSLGRVREMLEQR